MTDLNGRQTSSSNPGQRSPYGQSLYTWSDGVFAPGESAAPAQGSVPTVTPPIVNGRSGSGAPASGRGPSLPLVAVAVLVAAVLLSEHFRLKGV